MLFAASICAWEGFSNFFKLIRLQLLFYFSLILFIILSRLSNIESGRCLQVPVDCLLAPPFPSEHPRRSANAKKRRLIRENQIVKDLMKIVEDAANRCSTQAYDFAPS
ncbi:hypothetical protein MPTK2_8g14190 [Marchantia polymorpha subsp. ruderalis]